jgi:hypothetical protein
MITMRAATVKTHEKSEAGVLPGEQLINERLELDAGLVKDDEIFEGELVANGTRVGFSGRKPIVIDGPFAETKG